MFLIPTATLEVLGAGNFGLGPTLVLLKQYHAWTAGVLANQIWSVAGDGDRDDVSELFLQPFLSYTFPTSTMIGLNAAYEQKTDGTVLAIPHNGNLSSGLMFDDAQAICWRGWCEAQLLRR